MSEHLTEISQKVRHDVLSIMDCMLAFDRKYPKAGLPKAESPFMGAKALLEKGEFNLVVCGKVKNGKSSLINALIGRELLPVCTDVATSRVFRIGNAADDSFFVVYDNGDRKAIDVSQLADYGSQETINAKGLAEADKTVAYIEVNTPLGFLPKGVAIIDTPGIGSVYPHHTAITKEYLSMADAALFVANPTPLEDIEVDFLKDIAEVTPNIMFVTTKIDLNGIESVDESIARNTELINKAIGQKLVRPVTMLRMSSTMLLQAAQEDDEDYRQVDLEDSCYLDVQEELLRTVFITQEYYRAGIAYNAARAYYRSVLNSLQNRLEGAKKSGKDFEVLLGQYEQARADFVEQMGDRKRQEVLAEVDQILQTMKFEFEKLFGPTGSMVEKYSHEIDALTPDTLEGYKNNLGSAIVSDARQRWEYLAKTVYLRMMETVTRYNEECKMLMPDNVCLDDASACAPVIGEMTFKDTMSAAKTEILTAGLITTSATTVVGALNVLAPAMLAPAMPIITPALAVIGVGVLLWGALSGKKAAEEKKLQKDKSTLQKFVQETIGAIRQQLVETSLQDGKYESQYQGFVVGIREQAQTTIQTTYTKYKDELDGMKKALVESKQNPKMIEALEIMISEWNENEVALADIKKLLDDSMQQYT